MRMLWVTVLLLVAAMAVPLPVLDAAPANPLVGTWTSFFLNAPAFVPSERVFLQIRSDGSYTVYAPWPSFGSAGTFTVTPPNRWRMVAHAWKYEQSGTYRLQGKKYLFLISKLGTDKWTRVTQRPYFYERKVFGQRVPTGIPLITRSAVAMARADGLSKAVPVRLTVDPQPSASQERTHAYGIAYFSVSVTVYSPSKHRGQEITVSPYSFHVRPVAGGQIASGRLAELPLAAQFVDLPKAIAAARSHTSYPFVGAEMEDWEHWGTVWVISNGPSIATAPSVASRKNTVRVLASGTVVPNAPGPNGDYAARYNAEWNRISAGLRSLFAHAGISPSESGASFQQMMTAQAHPAFHNEHGYGRNSQPDRMNGKACPCCGS